jgi:hypothetical protein
MAMPRRQRPPVKITVDPEELARRYRDGASLEDLAILYQCGSKRVRAILTALDIDIRPRGGNPGNPSDSRPNKFMRR